MDLYFFIAEKQQKIILINKQGLRALYKAGQESHKSNKQQQKRNIHFH